MITSNKLKYYETETLESGNCRIDFTFDNNSKRDFILLSEETDIIVNPANQSLLPFIYFRDLSSLINFNPTFNYVKLVNLSGLYDNEIDFRLSYNELISAIKRSLHGKVKMYQDNKRYKPSIQVDIFETAREIIRRNRYTANLNASLKSLVRISKNHSIDFSDNVELTISRDGFEKDSLYFTITKSDNLLLNGGVILHGDSYSIHT
jgi:hypothetical protein